MSKSEFRYNKKRKHYAYIFKEVGLKNKNILISSKSTTKRKKKKKNKYVVKEVENVKLYRHPNKNENGDFYLIPAVYIDDKESFSDVIDDWFFDINDKRKVKRIKKRNHRRNKQKKSATKPH